MKGLIERLKAARGPVGTWRMEIHPSDFKLMIETLESIKGEEERKCECRELREKLKEANDELAAIYAEPATEALMEANANGAALVAIVAKKNGEIAELNQRLAERTAAYEAKDARQVAHINALAAELHSVLAALNRMAERLPADTDF